MKRNRAQLVIEIDLDPVPGWGNVASDWGDMLQKHLDQIAPHYNPVVSVASTPPAAMEADR